MPFQLTLQLCKLQERLRSSHQAQRLLEPGRLVLLSDPSSGLPALGLLCGVLQPPGSKGFGTSAGTRLQPPSHWGLLSEDLQIICQCRCAG